jgi:RNA polymerase sigma-70 factor (ECF subfamily)
VSTSQSAETALAGLLAAARAGDSLAFEQLVAPHVRALHVHCYRMLGSLDDADEVLQESLLRAWRGLKGYQAQAPLRHWLYRITTTTSLKAIEKRGRQPVLVGEVSYLQPYPDGLLDELTDVDGDPAAVAERRESVTLAFIVALQRLPATQRAALILCDVLSWTARETAALLDTTVPAVNSALQRARATLATAHQPAPGRGLSDRQRQVLDRFIAAWHQHDMPALAALLREDVILTMPPRLGVVIGRNEVVRFLSTEPAGGRLELIRLVHTRANGQPALGSYLHEPGRPGQAYGIMVLTVTDDVVATIVGFPGPDLYDRFDLPAVRD